MVSPEVSTENKATDPPIFNEDGSTNPQGYEAYVAALAYETPQQRAAFMNDPGNKRIIDEIIDTCLGGNVPRHEMMGLLMFLFPIKDQAQPEKSAE